jgi:integrase
MSAGSKDMQRNVGPKRKVGNRDGLRDRKVEREHRYKKAVRNGRVRDVRFNDLRHTFGTRMAAAVSSASNPSGVNGTLRLQDHAHIRGLCPVRSRE